MVAATAARAVDGSGFGPAAPCSLSHAPLKPRAVLAVELFPSLAGAQSSAGRRANVEHGLLRSSANPGQVFEMRRPVAGAQCARLSWLRRSGSARLRRYGSGSILCFSFGGLPSVEPGAALNGIVVVPRNGGSFDEVNAGGSNFALERTASRRCFLADGSARRRSARALDRLNCFR